MKLPPKEETSLLCLTMRMTRMKSQNQGLMMMIIPNLNKKLIKKRTKRRETKKRKYKKRTRGLLRKNQLRRKKLRFLSRKRKLKSNHKAIRKNT